jgi:hypothetical protein
MNKNLDLFEPNPDPRSLIIEVFPIIDYTMRGMCAKPYPGHRKGCPKFNAGHTECPPDAPCFYDHFSIKHPVYAIVNEFNMAAHVQKMLKIHPDWSERQTRNVYYWQKGARAVLRKKIGTVLCLPEFSDYTFSMCPEAMGVNVTRTLAEEDIILEWPPVNIARQVALIGRKIS